MTPSEIVKRCFVSQLNTLRLRSIDDLIMMMMAMSLSLLQLLQ